MLKCIEQRSLGIPPKGPREIELIRRVELLAKKVELSKRLGRKSQAAFENPQMTLVGRGRLELPTFRV